MLSFKRITQDDHAFLFQLLSNKALMTLGWGKVFTENDTDDWIDKINSQYHTHGYSYFLVYSSNIPIGIAGLLPTTIADEKFTELAYVIDMPYQHQGFATSIGLELFRLAKEEWHLSHVIAQFVPENLASKKVAQKLNMTPFYCYLRQQNDSLKEHLVYHIHL